MGEMRSEAIRYQRNLAGVDWEAMKAVLLADEFDNGRTPGQLEASFANSALTCIAYDGERMVGTARILSDGVCNAYVVDVWTLGAYRWQGIARTMIESMLVDLPGQHVYLFTEDDALGFYKALGFKEQGIGVFRVVGDWLDNRPPAEQDSGEGTGIAHDNT